MNTNILYQIKSYLKFLWHSKNEHAVHSPFVFNLITKCFYDTKSKPDPSGSGQAKQYVILKEYRKHLLEKKNSIEITNFDAGFKVLKANSNQFCDIARTPEISTKRAELLLRITNYFQPSIILEIGTSLGLATSALSLGNPKAIIKIMEGCSNTANQLQLQKFNIENVELVISEFNIYLNNLKLQTFNFELIYFNSNHSKTTTLNYFNLLLPTICNESLWIFNAIHESAAMEEAWEIMKEHPKVTVTIDTFQWGLIFFRREQQKEHFIIRI